MARMDDSKDLLYIFINAHDQNVISLGISFQTFYHSLQNPPTNLLLLKHGQMETEFHMQTQLPYVTEDHMENWSESDIAKIGPFCWVDFEDVFNLDTINGQELAELLYLAHLKKHLSLPFYQTLNNRFAYLTENDGWLNKIYYKNWSDFYQVLSGALSKKLSESKVDKSFISFWRKKTYPPIEPSVLKELSRLLMEGVVFSFHSLKQARGLLEIPFYVVGDFYDMYEMMDVFKEKVREVPAGVLSFDKKQKKWEIQFSKVFV